MNSSFTNESNKSLIKDINIINNKAKYFPNYINKYIPLKCIYVCLLMLVIILLYLLNKSHKSNNNLFFFEKNQEQLGYCNNYGILVYDYYYGGKLHKSFTNIGDYIQSLAALQYLPKNCKPYFIDRDSVQFYHGPKVKLIMNGWHLIKEGNKYLSSQIIPYFVSYNLENKKKLPSIYIHNIKKFSPIGCRDIKSRDKFKTIGINSYFSSCLTTTLDIDYLIPENKRKNDIIFIDYKFGEYPKADKFLNSLKNYNFKNITYTYHKFNIKLSHLERFKLAKSLLEKYSKAKLIITTRIHGALPCLALHTPVILINKKYDYLRYPGIYELLNTIGINYNKKFEIRVNINDLGYVYNSKKYLEYSDKLKQILQNF